jgi:hypothetical protein
MTPKRLDLHDIRFEAKDAEIFRIPDTKTRLDTLQHYFFPRLEGLLHDTVDLIQDIYGVNPYERMTVTARPRHRREGWRFLDTGVVYMGLTGQWRTDRPLSIRRRDGAPFSSSPSRLLYLVYPEGELQVIFYPFSQVVDAPFLTAVAALIRDHCPVLAPLLALYHIAHTCVEHGVFVELSEAFSPNAITRATPSQQLALASPSWHFPLDAQMLPWPQLQGAFLVLYPLLEACSAMAAGEPHHLSEWIDAFQQWYLRTLSQEEDDMAAEMEPTAPTSPAPVLPDLDTFLEVCPWAIEQVWAEDF